MTTPEYIPGFVPTAADRHYNGIISSLQACISELEGKLASCERDRKDRIEQCDRMANDWTDFCVAVGVTWDTHEAVATELLARASKAQHDLRIEREATAFADENRTFQIERAEDAERNLAGAVEAITRLVAAEDCYVEDAGAKLCDPISDAVEHARTFLVTLAASPPAWARPAAPKGEFAKIFVVEGRQVLLYVEPHDEADYVLHQMTWSNALSGMVAISVELNVSSGVTSRANVFEAVVARNGGARSASFIRTVAELESAGAR